MNKDNKKKEISKKTNYKKLHINKSHNKILVKY